MSLSFSASPPALSLSTRSVPPVSPTPLSALVKYSKLKLVPDQLMIQSSTDDSLGLMIIGFHP